LVAVLALALLVVTAALLSLRGVTPATAQSTSMRIQGTVQVYGAAATAGTSVQVFSIDPFKTTPCATASVTNDGRYVLDIGPLVAAFGCLQPGERMRFTVGGALANESVFFQPGSVLTVNLSVGFATPVVTPLPTPFPTPAPTLEPTPVPTPVPTAP